jgi:hypothetical protein
MARLTVVLAVASLVRAAAAQPPPSPETPAPAVEPGPSDAPATDAALETARPPIVSPEGADAVGRDQDRMRVEGTSSLPEGFTPAGVVGGNEGAVIQGPAPSRLPEGALGDGPVPIGAGVATAALAGMDLSAHGFVQAELQFSFFDNDTYDTTFLPRELELDVSATYLEVARIQIDLNLLTSPEPQRLSDQADLTSAVLFDALVEQAFAEWRKWGVTLRAGKMNIPFGSEPIDARDRVSLSRSTLTQLAAPSLLTGALLSYAARPALDLTLALVNGWDVTVDGNRVARDGNRSKTLVGAVPHRFGALGDGRWLYTGNLATVLGAEQRGINDLKWILDYSGTLRLGEPWALSVELLYGEEQGEGYNRRGFIDGTRAAQWWGGMLTLSYTGCPRASGLLEKLKGDLRIEYLHDNDLSLGLPHVSRMTTLLGTALTARYELVRGIDAALAYEVDLERGDVKGLSSRRNVSNIFAWYATQELVFGLVAAF